MSSYWITVQGYGTCFSTEDMFEAEEKFATWCRITGQYDSPEVILYADLNDGNGATIWQRH